MKNSYKYLIIALISVLLLIPLIIRGLPSFGMDSYAFVNYVYGITNSLPTATPILATLFFNILPANILVIWGTLFTICFTTLILWKQIGEMYSKKYGWLASLILISSPFFLNIFFRLEDDVLAIIPLSLAFYFGYKYRKILKKTGVGKFKYVCLTLVSIIVAGMFWKFSIYYIFLFLLITKLNPLFVISTIGVIVIFQEKLISGILPSLIVTENYPIIGIFGLGFLLIYFLKIFRTKDIEDWFVIFLLFLNLKFIFLAVPVLTVKVIQNIDLLVEKYGLLLFKSMIVGVCVFIFVGGYNLLSATPSTELDELFSIAQETKEHTKNELPILANWDFGYYYVFWDKEPKKFYGSIYNDIKNYEGHIIVANKSSRHGKACKIIYENNKGQILDCA